MPYSPIADPVERARVVNGDPGLRRWIIGGASVLLVGYFAALGAIASCTPSPPLVNPLPTCEQAADHADAVCAGAGPVTLRLCASVEPNDPGFAVCLAAATSCADLKCDAAARAAAKR